MYGKAVNEQYAAGCITAAATPVSPVLGAASLVRNAQDITQGLIGDLCCRLDCILSAQAPTSDTKDGCGRASHSELHGNLNDLVSRQESINTSLLSLLDRLTI